jgi:hypothetical protein
MQITQYYIRILNANITSTMGCDNPIANIQEKRFVFTHFQ